MRVLGSLAGVIIAVMLVVAGATFNRAPLYAAGPVAAPAAAAARSHAFHPLRGVDRMRVLPPHGVAYLSMVAGDEDEGMPAVAAVRDEGKLRLVRAGDKLEGAVIAQIRPYTITLHGPNGPFVMARAR